MKYAGLLPVVALLLAACGNANIEGLKTFKYEGGQHQQGQVQYAETPPVGGTHNPRWQNCGVYDAPIASEYAVHSLEHGAVWITYREGLPQDQVDQLKKLVDGQSYALLSPFPDLPSPIVASAWNNQLSVENAGDERLEQFIDKFENGPQAPERGAACTGGVSDTF